MLNLKCVLQQKKKKTKKGGGNSFDGLLEAGINASIEALENNHNLHQRILLDYGNGFNQANMLVLRNPSVFNFYDLPAMSLPVNTSESALPVVLMAVGRRGCDRDLLAMCAALQAQMSTLK